MQPTALTTYYTVIYPQLASFFCALPLPHGWRLEAEHPTSDVWSFYDTFSWHAFLQDVAIVKKGKILALYHMKSGVSNATISLPTTPTSFFASELPPCALQEELATCTTLRAYLQLCSVEVNNIAYRLLDNAHKTLAIINYLQFQLPEQSEQDTLSIITVTPLRGYQKESGMVEALIKADEAIGTYSFNELYRSIMQAYNLNVGAYSTKLRVTLDADAPAAISIAKILQWTFSIMQRNEEGMCNNFDTEFLHDYRVAIRRSRSLLKQTRSIFLNNEIEPILTFLTTLGKRTNALRDCDVLLLHQKAFTNALPPLLQPALQQLFTLTINEKEKLQKELSHYIKSNTYIKERQEWQQKLLPPYSFFDSHTRETLTTKIVAITSLRKAWKKMLRYGRTLHNNSTDTELHTLRIHAKKVRYLLECFQSLFVSAQLAPLLQQLKALQESLGTCADKAAHLQLLEKKLSHPKLTQESAAALGALLAILYQEHQTARLIAQEAFAVFDSNEKSALFNTIVTNVKL